MRASRAGPAALLLGLVCIACAGAAYAGADRPLAPLAKIGRWPFVSGLIGYGDRRWLVNCAPEIDHNSADLYSCDPRSRALRYERHLFGRDAGRPAVAGGVLYRLFEDPRFSAVRAVRLANKVDRLLLRAVYRHGNPPDIGLHMVGFRCAAD